MDSISRSSSSSDIIGNNADLFTQILLCLPVKPLLVFKSVSKQWFSAISDPLFIKQHTQKQNLRSLMVQTASKKPTFDFISLDGSSSSSVSFETLDFLRARIKQSCNGLLCCSSHNKDNEIFTYYICNPSTKQYRRIVDFTVDMAKEKGFEMLVSVSLAYDPLKSPHYKAICVWKMSPEQCIRWSYRIKIYSSETDSWKLCVDVFFLLPCIINTSGVYWNGSLHWVDTWDHENHICFNVDQELRSGMPPCSSLVYSTAYSVVEYFGECRGRLHHISRYGHPQVACIIDILEMKTDYTGWIKNFRVNTPEFPYPVLLSGFCVLHMEEVGDSFRLVLKIQDQVISYDPHERSFADLYKFASKTWEKIPRRDSSYHYIETLASV